MILSFPLFYVTPFKVEKYLIWLPGAIFRKCHAFDVCRISGIDLRI